MHNVNACTADYVINTQVQAKVTSDTYSKAFMMQLWNLQTFSADIIAYSTKLLLL